MGKIVLLHPEKTAYALLPPFGIQRFRVFRLADSAGTPYCAGDFGELSLAAVARGARGHHGLRAHRHRRARQLLLGPLRHRETVLAGRMHAISS